MHKASHLPHRIPQFRKVIRNTKSKIIVKSRSKGANPDEALALLDDATDTLLVESLTTLSGTAPAKVFRQGVRDLIERTLWPKFIELMIPTPEEIQRRREVTDYMNALRRIKDDIKDLAWQTAQNYFQPVSWSMHSTDPVTGTVYTWRGADVYITDNPNHGYTRSSGTVVVSPYAEELAGLFILVRDTCMEITNHMNKYELYQRLADTAIRVQKEEPNIFLRELTLEVLAEWYDVIDDWG